jgi:hypothetical protein
VTLDVVRLELDEANALVARWHRHHQPAQGHRFSIGVVHDGALVGAAIAGRPVSRWHDPGLVLEVVRCVTDGTRNACSFLYGHCARGGAALGFEIVQTYTLDSEHGASLRAAGFEQVSTSPGRQWKHTDGRPRRDDQPNVDKGRWVRVLHEHVEFERPALIATDQPPLF